MAHHQQLEFINSFKEYFIKDKIKILEIGSYNYNGSIRQFFENSNFTGVDVVKGKDVDIIYDGKNLNFKKNFYDLTISCECFEHNPYWKENFLDMINFTKPGGFVVVTCATLGRPEHGTERTDLKSSPGSMKKWNYYKNLEAKDFEKIKLKEKFSNYCFWENKISRDLYFIGIKKNNYKYENDLEKFSEYFIYKNSIVRQLNFSFKKKIIYNFKYILQNYFSKILSDKCFRDLWIFLKKF